MGILLCLALLHSTQYIVVLTLVSSLRASSFYSALIDNRSAPHPAAISSKSLGDRKLGVRQGSPRLYKMAWRRRGLHFCWLLGLLEVRAIEGL